jgi:DNA-binding MarR family transcriptional regulator
MDRTTLTAALKPLERRGLVAVRADSADRRSRRIFLTADGRALLRKGVVVWEAVHGALDVRLPGGVEGELQDRLRAVSGALQGE